VRFTGTVVKTIGGIKGNNQVINCLKSASIDVLKEAANV